MLCVVHQSAYGMITNYRRQESHLCYCGRFTTQTAIEKKGNIWERILPMIEARILTFPESSPDNRLFCLISKPLNLWYGLSLLLSKNHALGFLHNHAIISTSTAWNIRIMSAASILLKMKFTKADQAQKLDDSWKKKSESDTQRLSLSRLRGTNRFNLFPK